MFIEQRLQKLPFRSGGARLGSEGERFALLERGNSIREGSINISPLCGEDSYLVRTLEPPLGEGEQ